MMKQISADDFVNKIHERFTIIDLRHRAWLKKPPEYFEDKLHVNFSDTYDDLDYLKEALFSFENRLFFRIFWYKNQPQPYKYTTTVEMPKDYSVEEVSTILNAIKETCKLESDEIMELQGPNEPCL